MATEIANRKSAREGMFRPLKKKRFSDQIADLIQKKILEDNLAVGTGLPSEIGSPFCRTTSTCFAHRPVSIG
jgi:hypothetical protein